MISFYTSFQRIFGKHIPTPSVVDVKTASCATYVSISIDIYHNSGNLFYEIRPTFFKPQRNCWRNNGQTKRAFHPWFSQFSEPFETMTIIYLPSLACRCVSGIFFTARPVPVLQTLNVHPAWTMLQKPTNPHVIARTSPSRSNRVPVDHKPVGRKITYVKLVRGISKYSSVCSVYSVHTPY